MFMDNEMKNEAKIQPIENKGRVSDPFQSIEKVTSNQYTEVTKKKFPTIFTRPEYSHMDEKDAGYLYTLLFIGTVPSFEDALELSPAIKSIDQVLKRQHTINYPSTVITHIPQEVWQGAPPNFSPKNIAEARFAGQTLQPDFESGYPSQYQDKELNAFLAFYLLKGVDSAKFLTPIDLEIYVKQHDLSVDFDALQQGFSRLISRNNIDTLLRKKLISEDELPAFFQDIADWQVMLTEHKYKINKSNYDFPFFTHPTEPADVRALPNIADALVQYMLDVPVLVKENTLYNPVIFAGEMQRKLSYYEEIIAANKEKLPPDQLAVVKSRISGSLMMQNLLLEYYKRNGNLLNRSRPRTGPGTIPNSEIIRQEILMAGGAVTKGDISIRLKNFHKNI